MRLPTSYFTRRLRSTDADGGAHITLTEYYEPLRNYLEQEQDKSLVAGYVGRHSVVGLI